jgi:signal transduction histidine kinase
MLGFVAISITGCEKKMVDSMMDAADSSQTPTKDNPEAYTVALVQAATDLYKTEGLDAVITYYNDPANIDGQWYVFITDADDTFVAHAPRPDFIGTDLKDVAWLDVDIERHDGSTLGAKIAKATVTGAWIDYLWPNPVNGQIELKRTWAIRHDGYLFGSGYYVPAEGGSEEESSEKQVSEEAAN